jgi:hypothetical protein
VHFDLIELELGRSSYYKVTKEKTRRKNNKKIMNKRRWPKLSSATHFCATELELDISFLPKV